MNDMRSAQLGLPLEPLAALGREDFITAPGNAAAVGFIDAYPNWPAPAAALYGPPASGKTHLVRIWAARSGARIVEASALDAEILAGGGALAVENVDGGAPKAMVDESIVFALLERGTPLLLTGREPPDAWPARLPDLASRTRALLAFGLWAPDDALLQRLAVKLFADRQLAVPETVVTHILRALERSPAALRDFVARADAAALAARKPVNLPLIRALLAEIGQS